MKNRIMIISSHSKAVPVYEMELIRAAEEISEIKPAVCDIIILGDESGKKAKMLAPHISGDIITVPGYIPEPGDMLRAGKICTEIMGEYEPDIVLMSTGEMERELAPICAALMDSPLISDCVGVSEGEKGEIYWIKSTALGTIVTKSISESSRPLFVTIRRSVFTYPLKSGYKAGIKIMNIKDRYKEDSIKAVHRSEKKTGDIFDIEDADVVVAGGNGAGGEEGFLLIKELALLLGGKAGASRPAVDRGWADQNALIGQSGKTVSPRIYIACGISGSVQHLTGIRDSKTIISINKDPKALIIDSSDYSIVGDLFSVIPSLIEEIRKIKA